MEINTMKDEWGGEDGVLGRDARSYYEHTLLLFSSSALELTIQLFAEYIECHAILMTPSMRRFPDSLLVSPRFFI